MVVCMQAAGHCSTDIASWHPLSCACLPACLPQAHSARTVSVKERDALMNELHSLAGSFRSKHDKLHEQVGGASTATSYKADVGFQLGFA